MKKKMNSYLDSAKGMLYMFVTHMHSLTHNAKSVIFLKLLWKHFHIQMC